MTLLLFAFQIRILIALVLAIWLREGDRVGEGGGQALLARYYVSVQLDKRN